MRETKLRKISLKIYSKFCDSKEIPDLGKKEKKYVEVVENGYNLYCH